MIEYTADVRVEWTEGGDDEAETDSTAEADFPPDAGADTLPVHRSRHVAGPMFIVNLTRPGRWLRIWVMPDCSGRPAKETIETARALVRSLRLL